MGTRAYSSELSLKRRRLYLDNGEEETDKKHCRTSEREVTPLPSHELEQGEIIERNTEQNSETMIVDE
jgi:hypothetical protein